MRLFVAIELDPPNRERLRRTVGRLKEEAPRSKWVVPENLHLTVLFLGNVPDAEVPGLSAALDAVAQRHPAHAVEVGGGGAFGSPRRPRVLWVAVEGDTAPLLALQADVEEAMTAFGHQKDTRAYHPHITLARGREPRGDAALGEVLPSVQGLERLPLQIDEVLLMHSQTGAGGARYTPLHRAKLCARR